MAYPGFEVFVELLDFIDGVEEDKDLRLFIDLLVEVLEDGADDVLVHFRLIIQDLVVILDSFQSDDLFAQLLLNQLVDVELDDVLDVFFVEIEELLLHGRRAGDQVRPISLHDLQDFGQSFLLLLVDIIYFVDSHELAVVKLQISPLGPIDKGLGHGHNDISMFVLLFIQSADLEPQLLRLLILSEIVVLLEDPLKLILQDVGLDYDHALWLEDLVLLHLSLAE